MLTFRPPPSSPASSASVFASRCGASYITMVRVSRFNSSITRARSFFSVGRNASKQKRLVGSPEIVSAVTHAHAPGTAVTSTPASSAILTSSSPGSLMPGMPASVITAMFLPAISISVSSRPLSKRLLL